MAKAIGPISRRELISFCLNSLSVVDWVGIHCELALQRFGLAGSHHAGLRGSYSTFPVIPAPSISGFQRTPSPATKALTSSMDIGCVIKPIWSNFAKVSGFFSKSAIFRCNASAMLRGSLAGPEIENHVKLTKLG